MFEIPQYSRLLNCPNNVVHGRLNIPASTVPFDFVVPDGVYIMWVSLFGSGGSSDSVPKPGAGGAQLYKFAVYVQPGMPVSIVSAVVGGAPFSGASGNASTFTGGGYSLSAGGGSGPGTGIPGTLSVKTPDGAAFNAADYPSSAGLSGVGGSDENGFATLEW